MLRHGELIEHFAGEHPLESIGGHADTGAALSGTTVNSSAPRIAMIGIIIIIITMIITIITMIITIITMIIGCGSICGAHLYVHRKFRRVRMQYTAI